MHICTNTSFFLMSRLGQNLNLVHWFYFLFSYLLHYPHLDIVTLESLKQFSMKQWSIPRGMRGGYLHRLSPPPTPYLVHISLPPYLLIHSQISTHHPTAFYYQFHLWVGHYCIEKPNDHNRKGCFSQNILLFHGSSKSSLTPSFLTLTLTKYPNRLP